MMYVNRKNVYDRQTLLLGDVQSVLRSNFNASWPVKMYAGGWPGGDGGNVRVRTSPILVYIL